MVQDQIKYKLGLFKIFSYLYEKHSISSISDLEKKYHNDRLKEFVHERFIDHFPYLGKEDKVFNSFYQRIIEDLQCGVNPSQYLKFFKSHYFHNELETISSSVLLHFISPNYFLEPLKKMRLFPSKANLWEFYYNPLESKTKLHLNEDARIYLGDALSNTNKTLNGLESAASHDLNINLKGIKTPIFNCFTDISIESISFHAAHYGAYGIAFNKERVLRKVNNEERNLTKITPVAYRDPYKSAAYKLLINESYDKRTSEDSKEYLMELLSIKIMLDEDLEPSNYYSAFYEREWRYISYEKVFEFEYKDIEFITIPKSSYERHFMRGGEKYAPVKHISEIINFANSNNIKIVGLASKIGESDEESIVRDRHIDGLLKKE